MALKTLTYSLIVEKRTLDGFVEIANPFTIDFDIKKNNFKSAGTFTAKIYNLAPGTRESIRIDQAFDLGLNPRITMSAGYKDFAPMIFDGKVTSCYTTKEGPNIVTFITGFDDGLPRDVISRRSYVKGTPKQTIVDELISDLAQKGIKKGTVEPITGVIDRGLGINQKTTEALSDITNGKFWIHDLRANVTSENFPVRSSVRKIDNSRLINVPVSQSTNIFFDLLFNPGLLIGQNLELESKISPQFNGVVSIISIGHKGTISDSMRSSVITNVGSRFKVNSDIFKRLNQ